MQQFKHIGLFEGIGGFSLAAEAMGWQTVAWCEINEFCAKILRHYFPNAEAHYDIKKTNFKKYHGKIDILTGGFPCQPYSNAGKRLGKEDPRHLWPEMLRAIREIKPRYIVGENVSGLINWGGGMVFNQVQTDLENEGYEVLPFVLPACAVNAPHRRDRVWFIAYADSNGCSSDKTGEEGFNVNQRWEAFSIAHGDGGKGLFAYAKSKRSRKLRNESRTEGPRIGDELLRERSGLHGKKRNITNTSRKQLQGGIEYGSSEKERQVKNQGRQLSRSICTTWEEFPTEPPICGGNDGLPNQLDGITIPKWRKESIKAYGNAIVPQVAMEIFKAIIKTETKLKK